MTMFKTARNYFWLVPLVMGIAFVAAGVFMIAEGRTAKNDVREALVSENIVTASDARIPETPVTDAATARAQADIIQEHSLNITGGLTFAEMDREDPNRAVYLNGVTLRTALNVAVMGFKVSDLVIGMGVFMIVIGATHVLFLAPAVYWAAQVANSREEELKRGAAGARLTNPA